MDSVHAGPVRVLLLSADFHTARLIDELLRANWSRVQLLAHAEWDAAAAQALVDHPSCCVLLDVPAGGNEATLDLLEYVRLSAPDAPIMLLSAGDDEALALEAVKAGAQDCLVKSELNADACSAARSPTRSSASARSPSSPTRRSTTS